MDAGSRTAYFLLLAASIGLGLWKGGAPERIGSLILLTMTIFQVMVMQVLPSRFVAVDFGPFASDCIGAAGFAYLAIEARRIWPLWAAALQVLSLSAHFARWADIHIPPLVYAVMRSGPTFGVIMIILAGTALHLIRLRRHGCDPCWQNWSRVATRSSHYRTGFSEHS